jgi:hypothetical protein
MSNKNEDDPETHGGCSLIGKVAHSSRQTLSASQCAQP